MDRRARRRHRSGLDRTAANSHRGDVGAADRRRAALRVRVVGWRAAPRRPRRGHGRRGRRSGRRSGDRGPSRPHAEGRPPGDRGDGAHGRSPGARGRGARVAPADPTHAGQHGRRRRRGVRGVGAGGRRGGACGRVEDRRRPCAGAPPRRRGPRRDPQPQRRDRPSAGTGRRHAGARGGALRPRRRGHRRRQRQRLGRRRLGGAGVPGHRIAVLERGRRGCRPRRLVLRRDAHRWRRPARSPVDRAAPGARGAGR